METIEINVFYGVLIIWIMTTINFLILTKIYTHNEIMCSLIFRTELVIAALGAAFLTQKVSWFICAGFWACILIPAIVNAVNRVKTVKDFEISYILDTCKREIKLYNKNIADIKEKLEVTEDKTELLKSLKQIDIMLSHYKFLQTKMDSRTDKSNKMSTIEAMNIVFNPAYYNSTYI